MQQYGFSIYLKDFIQVLFNLNEFYSKESSAVLNTVYETEIPDKELSKYVSTILRMDEKNRALLMLVDKLHEISSTTFIESTAFGYPKYHRALERIVRVAKLLHSLRNSEYVKPEAEKLLETAIENFLGYAQSMVNEIYDNETKESLEKNEELNKSEKDSVFTA
jgi:hypothetical protein